MMLLQVLREEPRPPRRLRDKIPRDLETICLKAMAKAPEQRYATARALAEDLRRWLSGEPIRARRISAWQRAALWVRRRPAIAALLVVGFVAALALVGVAVALRYNAWLQEAYREARYYQYFHHIALAYAGWRDGNMGPAEGLLDDCPTDQRAWEWYYLKRLCHGDLLTLRGHTDRVMSVAFSPDGTRLASASADGSIKVWDAMTGHLCLTLTRHTRTVWSVAFSPDGRRLASGSYDKTIKVWDATTGELLHTLRGHTSDVRCVAFSPDGRRLASASNDKFIKLWDANTGHCLDTLQGHTQMVLGVAFSPDGTRLASASQESKVRVWDLSTRQTALTLRGHARGIWCVAFSPDGRRLASASFDRTVKVWDMTSVAREVTVPLLTLPGHTSDVLPGHTSDVRCVAFSPDGTRLASASFDRTLKIWESTTGQELRTIKGHASGVWGVAFSPDGTRLASASWDKTVKIWDVMRSQETLTLKGGPCSVAFSRDGRRLASGSNDKTVKIWDVTTGQVLCALEGHKDSVLGVTYSPDGRRLASISDDGTVKVWDADKGQFLYTLPGNTDQFRSVAFSCDGKLASSSTDGTVKLWDVATGKELRTLAGGRSALGRSKGGGLAFSPNGTRLASITPDQTVQTVNVWDATTGDLLQILQGHTDQVWCVAFSPDGRKLATGSSDGSVRLWDATTGQEAGTLLGHASHVFGVAFSPDGTRLASASGDQSVRVWDATTGQEILSFQGDNRETHFNSVAFSPDGTRLASASGMGVVKVWDARPWTPEAAFEREALGLLDFLFAKPLRKGDVLDHLHNSLTITPEAKKLALDLAKRYHEETDPERYFQASWALLRQPYLNRFQYRYALLQAQTACDLAPENGVYLTALGVAQYRAGQYCKALETLTQADLLHKTVAARLAALALPLPPALVTVRQGQLLAEVISTNLAFLAMTHHQLGHKEQSQAALALLRETLSKPEWTQNEELRAFLREAQGLMGGRPAVSKE
jgi:WD40 repeat protein